MPSADQVPVKSPHSRMRWHWWVVLIAGSTGSALRAVRPPNLYITPDVSATSFTPPVRRVPCAARSWPSRPHAILAILLASAIAVTFVGRRASNAVSQGRCLVPLILASRIHRQRSRREQAAQIAIALFADTAKLLPAAARVLPRYEANPG